MPDDRAPTGAAPVATAKQPAEERAATPAMAQWFAMKQAHPDALLFFRMGDFYELFFADAEAAAAALDIALTARGEHGGKPIAMCGVPAHAAETYLARLIRRGFRVAIVEQMESAKGRTSKGPIRRELSRLVTPGTLTDDALLDSARPNLLLALASIGPEIGAAWLDMSTGLFETAPLTAASLPEMLARLDASEIIAPTTLDLGDFASRRSPDAPSHAPEAARRLLAATFGVASIEAFGNFTDAEAAAASAALDYVRATQAGKLPRLSHPVSAGAAGVVGIDAATRAALELTRARDGGTDNTLLASVRRTLTAAGARMLASWLSGPLTDISAIAARQDGWSWLLANTLAAEPLRLALRGAPDMARALARLSLGRGSPRDIASLRDGMAAAGRARGAIAGSPPALIADQLARLDPASDLADLLARGLAESPPPRLSDGGAIAAGFDGELDAHRQLRDDSRQVVARLQLDYAQRFGVASLKIRHHAQLGYVIEAPAIAVERLRDHPDLTLRQGMANGARFTYPELSDLDRRITEAADLAANRERAIFERLVSATLDAADALAACADALALLDVLQSCARLAEPGTWCRPEVSDDQSFLVKRGRHPVVEAALAGKAAFVPNDCDLSPERRVLLLTGPNMAGKSTYLRQNAIMAVLAQAGLPAPAEALRIGIVDRLYSRVGASDDLARGRSTFMVEMTETAAILHGAGPRSLVVLDEIGRGTATLDGLAIAWAVLEGLHSANRSRVIFATHFHELAALKTDMTRLSPHTMRVREWKGEVVFLHEVAEGAAGRSWGVHVAKLAGVPPQVVKRAGTLLAALERGNQLIAPAELPLFAAARTETVEAVPDPEPEPGPAPDAPATHAPNVLELALANLDPDGMTPREALDSLYRLKAILTPTKGG